MTPLRPLGVLALVWSIGGVLFMLGRALFSLTPLAAEALAAELSGLQWAFAVGWVAFMAYAEGYRGFHRRFSPRVVRRALHLARDPSPGLVLLGPMFVMGLVHATRRRMLASWALLLGIVGIVLAVRLLAQPWRGLVDLGVVVGLSIGAASILAHLAPALRGREPQVDPDLPLIPDPRGALREEPR